MSHSANVTDVNVRGINDNGQIIGSFQGGGYTGEESFLYSHCTYTILAFPGAIDTQANGINASGQVVGYYEVGSPGQGVTAEYSFIYSDGTYTTIDPPGSVGPYAISINDLGQIVGSYFANGTEHGFLATPPLPPIVMPDFTHATFGTTINLAAAGVLANDTPSVTGDTLTVSAVDGLSQNVGTTVAGAYGTLTLDADGSYIYSASGQSALPSSGVSEDFFGYTALEGGPDGGGSAGSTLSVVVTAPGLTYVAAPAGGSATQPNGGHYAVLDGTAGNAALNAANGVGAALVGGNGDTLNGANSGKDTFVFMGEFGTNTVNNYIGKANGNFDVIQLSKSDFGTNPAVIANDATQAPGSPNTVITDPINHDTITLAGVSLSSLHFDASHFLLV